MSNAPTWKVAVIGAVAVTAGCALVIVNWTVPQLAAFLATLFIARGALHLVTISFEGMAGALSAPLGLGEVAVIIGAVMTTDGVTELLLAIEAERQGERDATPLVASS